jgi:hypothetical protein
MTATPSRDSPHAHNEPLRLLDDVHPYGCGSQDVSGDRCSTHVSRVAVRGELVRAGKDHGVGTEEWPVPVEEPAEDLPTSMPLLS